MPPVQRPLLLDETVTHLRREIADGTFGEELPACRHLSAALQVSVPTVLAALERLAAEGLLERGKPRRPYRVAAGAAQAAEAGERRCVLLLSSKPLGEFDANSRSAIDRLIETAMRRGWEFQHRMLAYSGVRHPNRRWDEVLESVRPTHIVALAGTQVLAEWASEHGIPTLFIGGVPGSTSVTAIGVSLRERLEEALDVLIARGHHHISMPVCGVQESLVANIRTAFELKMRARGIPFVPNYHTPAETVRTRDSIRHMLANVIDARMPSAIVFIEWIDFVAAIGLLAEHGLFFGRDVTAVILTYDPQIEWFQPQPAHFVLPLRRLERVLNEWLMNPRAPRFRKGGLMLQHCDFHEGAGLKTIAPEPA